MQRNRRMMVAAGAVALSFFPRLVFSQLVALPGAEGFGASATGGRAGSVYVVTNLNDSGAGSLRDAVSQSNRIVVFNVGGYINLSSALTVSSNVTILGQTAPGQGVGIMGHEVSLSGKTNDIVQYLRFRPGNSSSQTEDAINIGDGTNMIIDHSSIEYGFYNNVDATGNSGIGNITLQNSIIADPTNGQQFNAHIQGNTSVFPNSITLANNVFTNAHDRNPLTKANDQFVNNVVYDYQGGYTVANTGGHFTQDILNNYFIAGPSTTSASDAFFQMDSNISAYAAGNLLDGNKDGTLSGSSVYPSGVTSLNAPGLDGTSGLPLLSAARALAFDMKNAGASFSRDGVDSQVISQVASYGTQGKIINTSADTGLSNSGMGTLAGGTVSISTAGDGLPDSFALSHGLSIHDTSSSIKKSALGYDMIEVYAQQLADTLDSQTWSATTGNWTTNPGNWTALPGVYDHALIRGTGSASGALTITTTTPTAYSLSIGGNGPESGESLTVSGGAATIYNTTTVGDLNNATLTINSGSFTTGNMQLGNTVWSGDGTTSTTYTGTLNLNGGTLQTQELVQGAGSPGNWTSGSNWNWSGGTLQAGPAGLFVSAPATLSGASSTIDTNAVNATLAGILSGNGSLTKISGGTLLLTGANTFTGPITISGGTVAIPTLSSSGPSPLGAQTTGAGIVLDGGALQFVPSSAITTSRSFSLTSNGGEIDSSGSSTASFVGNGAVGMIGAGDRTLTLSGATSGHNAFFLSLGDPSSGFTALVKDGAGEWDLDAAQTYSGNTTVVAGTLETLTANVMPNGAGKGNLVIDSGATFEMHANAQSINGLSGAGNIQSSFGTRSLTIGNADSSALFTGNILSGINLVKVGAGNQELSGTNSYTGPTTISGGAIQFDSLGAIGGSGPSVNVGSGGGVAFTPGITNTSFLARVSSASTGALALNSADAATNLNFTAAPLSPFGNMAIGAVGTVTYTGVLTPSTSTYRLGGGSGTLVYTPLIGPSASVLVGNVGSNGTVILYNASNTYTGPTIISGSTLSLLSIGNASAPSTLGNSSAAQGNLVLNGGTLQYAGAGGSTNRLFDITAAGGAIASSGSGAVAFTNSGALVPSATTDVTLTLTGTNSGHNEFGVGLSDPAGHTISVVKTGPGKWTFENSSNKNYSGDTHVEGGILETLGANTLSSDSNISIDSGAVVDLHGSSQSIDALTGAGTLTDSFFTSGNTLTIGAAGGSGTFAGILGNSNLPYLVKTGAGTQVLAGVSNYTAATTISGGALVLNSTTALPAALPVVNNASLIVNASNTTGNITGLGALTVNSSTLTLSPSTGNSNLASLAIAAGQLNLTNNTLFINYGSRGDPIATIATYIGTGRNKGSWNGLGIASSSVAANSSRYGIGYADAADPGNPAGLSSGTIKIMPTLLGDTNLDGIVNFADYQNLLLNFNSTSASWDQGDFTGEGTVNFADYQDLLLNFSDTSNLTGNELASLQQVAAGFGERIAPNADGVGFVFTAIPEPSSVAILSLACTGLIKRKRRQVSMQV